MSMFESYSYMMMLAFVVAGVYIGTLGLRGLVGRRPFMIPSWELVGVFAVLFLPQIVIQIGSIEFLMFGGVSGLAMGGLAILMPVLVVVFMWWMLRGHMVIGVSEDVLGEVVTGALEELEIPYEQRLSRIDLPSHGAQLRLGVQGWVKTAQIRWKGKEAGEYRRIIEAVERRLSAEAGPRGVARVLGVVYCLIGLVVLGFAVRVALW